MLKALLLKLRHAIVMRLYGRGVCCVFIPIPETQYLVSLREVAGLVGRIRLYGLSPGYPVPATGTHYHEDSFFHFLGEKIKQEQRN